MRAWKTGPDDADMDRWGWTMSTPPPSHFLPQARDPKTSDMPGPLLVSEVTVLPDSRYCFTVLKDDGHPVATFCFESLDGAVAGARNMEALVPHIAQFLLRQNSPKISGG